MGRRAIVVFGLFTTMVAQSACGFAGPVSFRFAIGNVFALRCSRASLPAVRVRLLSVKVLWTDFTNIARCECRSPGRHIDGWRLFSLALRGDVLASHRAQHRKRSMHGWDRCIHLVGIRGTRFISSKMILVSKLDTQ